MVAQHHARAARLSAQVATEAEAEEQAQAALDTAAAELCAAELALAALPPAAQAQSEAEEGARLAAQRLQVR